MDNDFLNKIKAVSWQHYLSRPFNLFETSVWNKWYDSEEIKNLLGIRLIKGFFIEYPRGMIRHYREKVALDRMFDHINRIAADPVLCQKILDQGATRNKNVKKLISAKSNLDLEQALKLCIEVALTGTIFPYFVGDVLLEKYGRESLLSKKAIALRSTSYYPQIFSELLIPAAKKDLKKQTIDSEMLPYILIEEILENNISKEEIEARKKSADFGSTFLYLSENESKIVVYTKNPKEYLSWVEPSFLDVKNEIKGVTGNPGKAKGKVRLVLSDNAANVMIENGEILVAVSTNPSLIPIMKKATAIITDEGGMLCHAAIMSRELGIPCIIGTKIATQAFKTGDMVEVDAENGIIRII
ncbi:MAG TPA: PEP-utilizing enzyme [Candidatus Paceibacterota bacterium]